MFTSAYTYFTLIFNLVVILSLYRLHLFMHEVFSITTEITSKLWHKYVNNNEQQQALEPA